MKRQWHLEVMRRCSSHSTGALSAWVVSISGPVKFTRLLWRPSGWVGAAGPASTKSLALAVHGEDGVFDDGAELVRLARFPRRNLRAEFAWRGEALERGGLPVARALVRVEAFERAVLEADLDGGCVAEGVEAGGKGDARRVAGGGEGCDAGRSERGLDVGDLEDDGVWPAAVVLEALREEGADVQAVGFLTPGGLGDGLRVLVHEVVLPEDGDDAAVCRASGAEDDVLPVAAAPGLGDNGVDRILILLLRVPDVLLVGDDPWADAVDGLAVDEHPIGDFPETLLLLDGQLAVRLGADVEEQVAALGAGLVEEADQLVPGLIGLVARLILPGRAHGDARLPRSFERDAGNVLLGRRHGAAGDDCARLRLPRDLAETLGSAVEEDDVDVAVLCHELFHLGLIEGEEAGVFGRGELGSAVDGEVVLVEPAEVVRREVEAGRDALRAERAHYGAEDVLTERGVHDAVRGRFGGPHGEARVVLGGEHDIADSREFGENGPVLGIELAGVERLREVGEESAGVVVGGAGEGGGGDRGGVGGGGAGEEKGE